jgi:hypothetical protein
MIEHVTESAQHADKIFLEERRPVPFEVLRKARSHRGGGKKRQEQQERVQPIAFARTSTFFRELGQDINW